MPRALDRKELAAPDARHDLFRKPAATPASAGAGIFGIKR
jgi:hypothetical protein